MNTPLSVIDKATTYLRIYFIGVPSLMIFNFGASILRAVGDTKKPLYILIIAGIINVLLNLLFVGVFNMDVEGVAYGTIISELISVILVLIMLFSKRQNENVRLTFSNLKLHYLETIEMLRIGLPSGLQNSIFSISNVLISSSINSFGEIALGAHVAASNIEGYVYCFIASISQATIAFASQNYGAKNLPNMKKIYKYSLIIVSIGMYY